MAIQFKEIKKYIARNVRLSICHEDGYYENYLFMADIPEQKYYHLYVYGIGMIDVEFSNDVYTVPAQSGESAISAKDITLQPAIEIVLSEKPRPIKRSDDKELLFRDLKPYLQIGKNFAVVKREDWSSEIYEFRRDIPEKYDNMHVYGIGMENHPRMERCWLDVDYETMHKKRMVIVLSEQSK